MTKKKVGMIIAFRDFKDEELFRSQKVLEKAGVEVSVISDKKGIAIGESGGEVEVEKTSGQVSLEELDGILFVGGPGALKHLDNKESYRLAAEAREEEKVLGAICISPVILAKAGVLKGKKATVWSSPLRKKPVKVLKKHGARFLDQPAVRDGALVTANGPGAAEEFGEKVLDALS